MNKLNAFLAVSILGTITNLMAEAKSVFGALAALASLIASCYAIAIARANLRKAKRDTNDKTPEIFPAIIVAAILIPTGCQTAPGSPNPLARGLDHAALALTATTTNVSAHEVVIANEVIALNPITGQLTTNINYTTNLTLLTNITAVARPILSRTVTTGEAASTLLPPPYGEAAAACFALSSGLLTWAVRRRNAMLKTVIQGVEASGNDDTKKTISDLSKLVGVAGDLHALVKKHT
jgi:hypothetical protein